MRVKSMPESDETQEDIKEIKWRIENIDNKFDMLVRGNDEALEKVAEVFRGDPVMAQVYLAVNGKRNQSEIVEEIDSSGPTVSRRISTLDDYGLIEKKDIQNGFIWKKSELHQVMQLGSKVDPETGWDDN